MRPGSPSPTRSPTRSPSGSPAGPPPRLAEGRDPVGGALRELRRGALPGPAMEGAAWRRLVTPGRPSRARWRILMAAAVAGGAVALLVMMVRPRPAPRAGAAGAGTRAAVAAAIAVRRPEPVAPDVVAPARPGAVAVLSAPGLGRGAPALRLALAPHARSLPAGRAALASEAIVDVAPGTVARASADGAWVRVVVERGDVRLAVGKRMADGPGFEVAAGPYRFRVLGTRFRVAHRAAGGDRVDLWVEEGRVAVTRGGRALGVVEAGDHWSGRAAARLPAAASSEAAPPAAASPVPAADATVPPRAHCAELAASPATERAAVACYLAEAAGEGIAAETALYEVGRLRRDALGDPQGALEAFRLCRARFPHGMLRAEVDLSIVELLPKMNRHREALEEIGRLLPEERGRERAAELLLLRANIYREVLEDFGRAERDYAAVEQALAPSVGDATFLRGVCQQALGRAPDARASFERYLGAGPPRFRDEAQRRLGRLGH